MKAFGVLILIILLGFFLRSGMLLHGDFLYLYDQARDLLLTKNLVVDHHLTLIGGRTGFGGLFHGALWIYLISPFFLIARGNPFWTLAPVFTLANIGIIVVGFLVGWRLYGKWVGVLIAFFLAISRELVNVGPVTTNAEVLPTVFLLYIFSIIKFIRGDEKYFIAASFLIGLGFQFESAFAILLIPLTAVAVLIRKKKVSFKNLAFGLIGFFAAVSSFILFDLRHSFLMTSSVVKLFTNTRQPLSGYEQYANISFRFLDRVSNLWNGLFTPLYTRELIPMILIVFFVGAVALILVKRIYRKEVSLPEKELLFILLSPFVIFGFYTLYPFPLWSHYLLPVAVLFTFVLSLCVKVLWEKPIVRPIIVIFLFLVFLPALISVKTQQLTASEYVSGGDGSYLNQLSVAKWVMTDAKDKNSSYFVYTPGILTYNMDYLFWWLAHTNQRSMFQSNKTENTYLIFYPAPVGNNDAQGFWKRNVVKTSAQPFYSRTFNGGISVEKIDLSKDVEGADPNYSQNLIFR